MITLKPLAAVRGIFFLFILSVTFSYGQTTTINIISTGDAGPTSGTNWSMSGTTLTATGTANIQASVIETALSSGDLTVVSGTGSDFIIEVNEAIDYTGATERTLTFGATHRVLVYQNISSTSAPLNIILASEFDRASGFTGGGFGVGVFSTITTNGGDIWIGGGQLTGSWNGHTVGVGAAMGGGGANGVGVETSNSNISTAGGDVRILGTSNGSPGINAYGSNSTINAGAGDIELISDRMGFDFIGSQGDIQIDGTGTLTIAPLESSFANAVTWDGTLSSGYYTSTGGANTIDGLKIKNTLGLTIGKPGNSAPLTIASDIVINGPISFESGSLTINANLETTSEGADILAKVNDDVDGQNASDGQIYIYSDKDITTNGGNIILWSNASNRTSGQANNEIVLDGSNTLTSNGGKIVLAGGLDGGDNNGTAGDGIPDGYAYRSEYSGAAVDIRSNVSLLSGGGDVIMRGHSGRTTGTLRDVGVWADTGFKLDAGTGTINIRGNSDGQSGIWLGLLGGGVSQIAITSASTAATAITIHGESTTNEAGLVANWDGSTGSHVLIESSASIGGGVTITGITNGTNGIVLGQTGTSESIQILSQAGDVSLISNQGLYIGNDTFLGNRKDANAVNGITPSVQTSSADVLARVNSFNVGSATIDVSAAGELTIEPYGNVFSSAYSTSGLTLGSALTGLTIGKSTNTANVTISNAIDIAGPITVYGGDIDVNANLTSTVTNADIVLKASGTVEIQDNTGIETNGGDLILWSNSDNVNGGNALMGQNVTLDSRQGGASTGGGHIHIAGGADTNSDGFPDDATAGIGNFTGGSAYGILFGNAAPSGVQLLSGGGNITLIGGVDGNFNSGANSHGIGFYPGYTVDAGAGSISFTGYGNSGGANTFGIDLMTFGAQNASSISTTGDLTLNGVTTVTTNTNHGIIINTGLTVNAGTVDITGDSDDAGIILKGSVVSNGAIQLKADLYSFSLGSISGQGTLTIEPLTASNSFSSTFSNSSLTLGSALTGLTIGKSTNTADVTIASAVDIAGPITVYGGDVTVSATLTSTNNNINLHATGAVTQTAAITAAGLGLHGTGTFTLANTSNNVATIAGGDNSTKLGGLRYVDAAGGLTVGTVGSSGIYSSDTIQVSTISGDLLITEPIVSTASSGDAILLYADIDAIAGNEGDGNIKITDNGEITIESGSRSLLYSGKESSSTGVRDEVGGSANTRIEVDTSTTLSTVVPAIASTGKYALFRAFNTTDQTTETDGDGVPDKVEQEQTTDPNDPDDFLDTDGDGVPDYVETVEGTDPQDPNSFKDTDGDGVPDNVERRAGTDSTDPSDMPDSDGDGVPDLIEGQQGTDANDASDFVDTDGDGVPDYVETLEGTDPQDPNSFTDTDGDGIPDRVESRQGTNPNNSDSDGDGVPDNEEQRAGTSANDASDFVDTDGDGVPDYVEEQQGTDPNDASDFVDTDGDGVPDSVEIRAGTDPNNPIDATDSDGDGVPDYVELRDGTDPGNAASYKDTDGDGVSDYAEQRVDSDGDGVPDYVEVLQGTDPNDVTSAQDTDGDGIPDYVEENQAKNPNDASDFEDRIAPVIADSQQYLYAEGRSVDQVIATAKAYDGVGVTGFIIDSVLDGEGTDVSSMQWYVVSATGELRLTEAGVSASGVNDYDTLPNEFILWMSARDAAGNVSSSKRVTLELVDKVEAIQALKPSHESIHVPIKSLFTWERDTVATHYHVQVSADTFRTVMVADTLTETSASINGLAYESTYHWRVRAANAYSTGPWSAPHVFTTELTPVARVGLILPAQNAVDVEIPTTFSWHPVQEAERYEFMLFTDAMLTTVIQTHTTDTSIVIDTLQANTNYLYRVRAKNATSVSAWTNHEFTTAVADSGDGGGGVVTSTEGTDALPTSYDLGQNYPNPFNPTTTIRYALPQASQVSLEVYDMLGRRVALLADGRQSAGYQTVIFDGSALASGVYIYRLRATNQATGQPFIQTRTLVFMK